MEYTGQADSTRNSGSSNGGSTIAAKAEEKVRELGENARLQAEERMQKLSQKAQLRIEFERDRVASRIEDAASRVRERGDSAGPIGHVAGQEVAHRMESAAHYLHERRSSEIAGDVSSYVKQHPLRSVVIAAAAGYIIGRLSG